MSNPPVPTKKDGQVRCSGHVVESCHVSRSVPYVVQRHWKTNRSTGEKAYNDNPYNANLFGGNPYRMRVVSPYGYGQQSFWGGVSRPSPSFHARSIHQTISLNNSLNKEAQAKIDAKEPRFNIWETEIDNIPMSKLSISDTKQSTPEKNGGASSSGKRGSIFRRESSAMAKPREKESRFSSLKKSVGMKSDDEKAVEQANELKSDIVSEEMSRWPDEGWRYIVENYQEKVGMTKKIGELRANSPIQYLHLLRAGFFEPIPVAWADQASNPLKFSIEAAGGWRGITPAWRGYEDTAEERLYWVLNHREGTVGRRLKPDFISEMDMARERMAKAVEPPPIYFAADDTCHVQHTSDGYSKQVMPAPFMAFDRPEAPTDDTMILLDVSGSMDFEPQRPVYDQYLIKQYTRSTQPKNKGKIEPFLQIVFANNAQMWQSLSFVVSQMQC